jgi:hypothetical protein
VLVQLLLEPRTRTLAGFAELLEKDVLEFGHKCAERLGFSSAGPLSREWAPIVLQILDATWQIMQQFPHAFEFSPAALRFLALAIYSGTVQGFCFDCARARQQQHEQSSPGARPRAGSIWPLLAARQGQFVNPAFRPGSGALRPATSLLALRLWDLFLPSAAQLAEQAVDELGWAHIERLGDDRPDEMAQWFRCVLTTTSRRVDSRGSEFTVYNFDIALEEAEELDERTGASAVASAARHFAITRRFSDFSALDAAIRAQASPKVQPTPARASRALHETTRHPAHPSAGRSWQRCRRCPHRSRFSK